MHETNLPTFLFYCSRSAGLGCFKLISSAALAKIYTCTEGENNARSKLAYGLRNICFMFSLFSRKRHGDLSFGNFYKYANIAQTCI